MSSVPAIPDLAASARWLVQALDAGTGTVRLVEMDPEAYRAASFLDDRMLQQRVRAQAVRWDDVEAAAHAGGARTDARWIFHIGHVGSTLVARLLGELPGVLSVREPRILRDLAMLAEDRRERYVAPLRYLLSRTFDETESALVKATSFVSEIAAELVPADQRALFLYASPRAYISTILAGANSQAELDHFAEGRQGRLRSRGIALPDSATTGAHRAAAAWACEMTALEAAAERMADRRLQWADFDAMLERMERSLADVARFFGFRAPAEIVRALANGPLMRRYSKALEYEYSPGLRRELLDEAKREHRADIDSALAMLHRAAETSPLLERALGRCASES